MLARALALLAFLSVLVLVSPSVSAGDGAAGDVGLHARVEVLEVTRAIGSGSSSCSSSATVSSLTFSHGVSTGAGRFLQVSVFHRSILGTSVSSITYAGQSLTSEITQALPGASTGRLEVWDLSSPPAGTANVVVTFSGSVDGVIAFAVSFNNVNLFSRQQSQTSTASSISDTAQTGSPPLSNQDLAIAYVGLDSTQGEPTADSPQSSRGSGSNDIPGTTCNSMAVSTRPVPGSTVTMGYTSDGTGNWAQIIVVLHPIDAVSGGDPGPTPGGGGVGFPADAKPLCAELGPADWILPTTRPGSLNVTIEDRRREASLALQYLVSWGDGTAVIVPKTPVSHAYAKPDIYTITMRIQYRDGSIQLFTSFIDLRGNNCALSAFVAEFFPILGMLGGLTAVGAFIVTLSQRERKKAVLKFLRKWLLAVTAVAFGIIIAVAIYMQAAGIPFT